MGNQSAKAGVVVWGQPQDGSGNADGVTPPRLIEQLRHVHVRSIVCGGHHRYDRPALLIAVGVGRRRVRPQSDTDGSSRTSDIATVQGSLARESALSMHGV